jgi:hypothetical protein
MCRHYPGPRFNISFVFSHITGLYFGRKQLQIWATLPVIQTDALRLSLFPSTRMPEFYITNRPRPLSYRSLSFHHSNSYTDATWNSIVNIRMNVNFIYKLIVSVLNWAPHHEGVLGNRRYSSTHSLALALDGDEWSASRPGRFSPRERVPATHWIGGGWAPEPFLTRWWR